MEYRLAPSPGKELSIGLGVLSYSIRPGTPLWVAIEADDLPLVQSLATEIVESGINIFAVAAPVPAVGGGVAFGSVLGLACECKAVETAVWLYRQIPSFLPAEWFELSTRGFLSIIEMPSADKRLVEISRRCLEWSFTGFHEDRIKSRTPLKPLGAGPIAEALFMDIGSRLQAAHDQEVLDAQIRRGRVRPRAARTSARL